VPRALIWVGIVALFFAAVAPTLSWLEFSGGMENLNIATALELRRDHPDNWLIPTLEACVGFDADAIAEHVMRAALDFQGGQTQDDVALLVLRVPPT